MRLIDADELMKKIEDTRNSYYKTGSYIDDVVASGMCEAEIIVMQAPTIEAEPVRHGKWHRTFVDGFNRWHFVYDCSECGIRTETTTKYCPNCGAKMDGKKAEEKE